MDTNLLAHLESHSGPLRVPRRGAVVWDDEARHAAAYHSDPQRYALLALVPGLPHWQRARILLQLLLAGRAGLDGACRRTLERVTDVLLLGLPAAHVGTVLLAARRRRANHKHVTRATLRLLLDHPDGDALIRARRATLVDCFEHALGKATARGCARALNDGAPRGGRSLHRSLMRYATDPVVAARRVRALYAPASALPATGDAPYPPRPLVDLDPAGERPDTVTPTNRGDIAATLVHLYRGGPAAELRDALDRYVATAAGCLTPYPGTVALVLDLSRSMRGFGEREWAAVSQAVAVRLVLERVCARLVVVPVGGSAEPDGLTRPAGATDLATGLIDAVAERPDVVAVVSDGYENVYPGDLARVAGALARIGPHPPVVCWTAAFSHRDDLSMRRPAPTLPQRAFWHQEDFGALVLWTLAHAASAEAERWLLDELRRRLAAAERTVRTNVEGSA